MNRKESGFEKKEKRDTAITVRITKKTTKKLKKLAKDTGWSQADIIEKLVNDAYGKEYKDS